MKYMSLIIKKGKKTLLCKETIILYEVTLIIHEVTNIIAEWLQFGVRTLQSCANSTPLDYIHDNGLLICARGRQTLLRGSKILSWGTSNLWWATKMWWKGTTNMCKRTKILIFNLPTRIEVLLQGFLAGIYYVMRD